MTDHDKRPGEVKRLRAGGATWRVVARRMGLSVTRVRQLGSADTSEPAEPQDIKTSVHRALDKPEASLGSRRAAQRVILCHRIRGEYVPKELRIHEDLRWTGGNMIRMIRSQMRTDGATLDDVERYVEAQFGG